MKSRDIFFIGIKGSGMSSLAKICLNLGYNVAGSDTSDHIFTEDSLRALNVPIYDFDQTNIKDNTIVVAGNSFDNEFPEVKAALNNETVEVYRYHEFLGKIMHDFKTIAVSGAHGKTTTTTILKDMLSKNVKTGYLIGDGHGQLNADDEYFAVEACEFKRHFLAYHPEIAIMTNFELDHVDYFKDEEDYLNSFREFGQNVKELIIVWGDDPNYEKFNFETEVWTYGFSDKNKIKALNIINHPHHTVFDLYIDEAFIREISLPMVGDHMILNSLATIAVGVYEGIAIDNIIEGLLEFKGAARRYVITEVADSIIVDDYAHHPTEIALTLDVTKRRYPNKKLVAVFKPDRASRIKFFGEELKKAFTKADHVYFLPFNELDGIEKEVGIDISFLENKVAGSIVLDNEEEAVSILAKHAPASFVFMSSKNVYDLEAELKELLQLKTLT